MERGKINLRECEAGDILISALGARLEYVRPTKDSEYLDHIVRYLDTEYPNSIGSRTHDGYVFANVRIPESDHDIVEIIKKERVTENYKSLKSWRYTNSTNTIWCSFDTGIVEAYTKEEAEEKAIKRLKYDLKKVNEVLDACDSTIGFTIEMDFKDIEIEEFIT